MTTSNKQEPKVGDWVIWSGYVCQVTDVDENFVSVWAIGFDCGFTMTINNFISDSKFISEQEAIFLLLKNHKAFVGNI